MLKKQNIDFFVQHKNNEKALKFGSIIVNNKN